MPCRRDRHEQRSRTRTSPDPRRPRTSRRRLVRRGPCTSSARARPLARSWPFDQAKHARGLPPAHRGDLREPAMAPNMSPASPDAQGPSFLSAARRRGTTSSHPAQAQGLALPAAPSSTERWRVPEGAMKIHGRFATTGCSQAPERSLRKQQQVRAPDSGRATTDNGAMCKLSAVAPAVGLAVPKLPPRLR